MKKFKKRELEKNILNLRKEIWDINRTKDIVINECNQKDFSLKLSRTLIKEDVAKEKTLNKEIEKLKKEIKMYRKEHEKQEKFQNDIYKEKESLKLEVLDLKSTLKESIKSNSDKLKEIEKLKRDIARLQKEREILYNDASSRNFVDKILKDNKLYYIILSTLIIVNIFLIKVM